MEKEDKVKATIKCAENSDPICEWSARGFIPSSRMTVVEGDKRYSGAMKIFKHHNSSRLEHNGAHGHMDYSFETDDGRKGVAHTFYGVRVLFNYTGPLVYSDKE